MKQSSDGVDDADVKPAPDLLQEEEANDDEEVQQSSNSIATTCSSQSMKEEEDKATVPSIKVHEELEDKAFFYGRRREERC